MPAMQKGNGTRPKAKRLKSLRQWVKLLKKCFLSVKEMQDFFSTLQFTRDIFTVGSRRAQTLDGWKFCLLLNTIIHESNYNADAEMTLWFYIQHE